MAHRPMDAIHGLLAYAAVASTAAGMAWSLALVISRRAGGPGFERFQAAVVTVLLLGAASGLIMLASGARPGEGLHLLYAILAVGLIPLARSFLGRASGMGAVALLLAAFVVLGAVVYRLYTTG